MGNWFFRWFDRLFPHSKDADQPCIHMKQILSELSDESAHGAKRWYGLQHVAGCPGCARTLERLKALRNRLGRLRVREPEPDALEALSLTPDRRAEVEAAWDRIDRDA